MSGRLFIYGTGAHARKAFNYAMDLGWCVVAFVDDRPAATAPCASIPVLRPAALEPPGAGDALFIAIGDPAVRRTLMDRLVVAGWNFPSLVHRTAWVARDVTVGPGSMIAAGAVVETGTIVGTGVIIDIGATVDHDCRVGDFCHLRAGAVLGAGCVVTSPP